MLEWLANNNLRRKGKDRKNGIEWISVSCQSQIICEISYRYIQSNFEETIVKRWRVSILWIFWNQQNHWLENDWTDVRVENDNELGHGHLKTLHSSVELSRLSRNRYAGEKRLPGVAFAKFIFRVNIYKLLNWDCQQKEEKVQIIKYSSIVQKICCIWHLIEKLAN